MSAEQDVVVVGAGAAGVAAMRRLGDGTLAIFTAEDRGHAWSGLAFGSGETSQSFRNRQGRQRHLEGYTRLGRS